MKEDAILKEFSIIEMEELRDYSMAPKQLFLHPWLEENTINLISGQKNSGKTALAIQIIEAITREKNCGMWKCLKPVACLYIEAELDLRDFRKRMYSVGTYTDWRRYDHIIRTKSEDVFVKPVHEEERKAPLWVLSRHYARLEGLPDWTLNNEGNRQFLEDFCVKEGIKIVILDNISSLTPGLDEQSKTEWSPINQWLLSMRHKGIASIMVDHYGKDSRKGARGTSHKGDNTDSEIRVERISETSDLLVSRISFDKSRILEEDKDLIRSQIMKQVNKAPFVIFDFEFSDNTIRGRNAEAFKKFRNAHPNLSQNQAAKEFGIARGTASKYLKEEE